MTLEIRDDARLAGQVVRYHTWPSLRQQSVGEHSWQVCRILLAIAPSYDSLLRHAIVHDIGEIGCGDVPYPVKANNPELGRLFDEIEHATASEICERWMLPPPMHEMGPTSRWVFKLAEFIEMWEWGLEELKRGNEFARKVRDRCWSMIQAMIIHESADVDVMRRAVAYCTRRQELWSV